MKPWHVPILACGLLAAAAPGARAASPAAPGALHSPGPAATRAAFEAAADSAATGPDTLRFEPDSASASPDTLVFPPDAVPGGHELSVFDVEEEGEWLRAPIGDPLITDADEWRSRGERYSRVDPRLDYNRVDQLRIGVGAELQDPGSMAPRLGGRIEYATGRKRTLYGVQIEQPLLPPGRLTLGVNLERATDHNDLQQVEDYENTLAFLFGRQDYRDYFEREGLGAFLAWRVPDFSTVSVHVRNDQYRSLPLLAGTRSFFNRDRPLRANPPVDEGEITSVMVRLERLAHRTHRTRAGLYHWIEFERAGHGLGGDFTFTRALADVRSVLRLSPATTLALRAVGGATPSGTLPFQRSFTVGGVDGLRAHGFAHFRGDQMLLGQAEYSVGLWRGPTEWIESGLRLIGFVDVGRAWSDPSHAWRPQLQRYAADGGVGIGTSDDDLRVYFAKNLQKPGSDFVISVRLQRPF